jgi:hypothetical protein
MGQPWPILGYNKALEALVEALLPHNELAKREYIKIP